MSVHRPDDKFGDRGFAFPVREERSGTVDPDRFSFDFTLPTERDTTHYTKDDSF